MRARGLAVNRDSLYVASMYRRCSCMPGLVITRRSTTDSSRRTCPPRRVSPARGGLIARIRSIDPTRAHVEIWWGKPYWASRQYPSAPARQRKLLRAPSPSPARSVRLQENRPQNGAFETVYGQVHGGMILRMVLSASVVRNVTGRVMCEFVRYVYSITLLVRPCDIRRIPTQLQDCAQPLSTLGGAPRGR